MTRLNRDYIGANHAEIDYASILHGMFNNPKNMHNLNVWNRDGNHYMMRSDGDEIGPLALQQGKPHDEVESGEGGYAACMHFVTLSGQRIGTLAADVTVDGHNHVGLYTNAGINSDGSDSQPVKRLNVQGGAPVTSVDWYAVNEMRFGQRGAGNGAEGNLDFIMEGETGQNQYITLRNAGTTSAAIAWRDDWEQLRINNYRANDSDVRFGDGYGDLTARDGGPYGEGGIGFGTRGASVYTDGGHVYAQNADGEEVLVV